MYLYSSGPSKGAISTRPCKNTSHPSHAFKKHANSNYYHYLEKKLALNDASVYDQKITGVKKSMWMNFIFVNAFIHYTTWSL